MTGAHYLTLSGHYIIRDAKEKVWKIENLDLKILF
jgi:hypothetical protein